MSEKLFTITGVDPVAVLGANDANLRLIRPLFPKLNLIARGDTLKVSGAEADIALFEERFNELVAHVARYNDLPRKVLDDIMGTGERGEATGGDDADVLVYGNAGLRVKARTLNQQKLVKAVEGSDMVFAIGPAGTGKTYTAVALAVKALKERKVRRIILTRPAVEAGENLGFLPGDLREKLDPYLQPLYDALKEMIPATRLADHLDEGIIQIAPLAFMRGRTLDHAFVILDEAQNATLPQLKMFLTRMGRNAKFVITGDVTQVDLPDRQPSGLMPAVHMLRNIEGISVIELDEKDVIRHELVTRVLGAFKELEQKTDKKDKIPMTTALPGTLMRAELSHPLITNVYRGKVRDVYTLSDGRIILVASDRISAFDVVLPRGIPHKGQVLSQLSWHMLGLTRHVAPNWAEASPDPNVVIGAACSTVKVEMVVRGYLAGHAWRTYQGGLRTLCGATLPEGMRENDRFPTPLITPSTKADVGHDEDITPDEILARGLCTPQEWDTMQRYALALFAEGSRIAAERGLLLVDTKYEFGRTADGRILLIDEIHTPDSSRYFYADGYAERQARGERQKQLSKEFVREWLIAGGFMGKEGQQVPPMDDAFVHSVTERYVELFERITGQAFRPAPTEDINARVQQAVGEYLG